MRPILRPVEKLDTAANATLKFLESELRKSDSAFSEGEKAHVADQLKNIQDPESSRPKLLLRSIRSLLGKCLEKGIWDANKKKRLQKSAQRIEEFKESLLDLHRIVNFDTDKLDRDEYSELKTLVGKYQRRIELLLNTLMIDPGAPTSDVLTPFCSTDADSNTLPIRESEERSVRKKKKPVIYKNTSGASGRHNRRRGISARMH